MLRAKRLLWQLPSLLLVTVFSTASFSQAIAMYQLDKEQRSIVVNTMINKINQQYVFPKAGQKSAEFISQQLKTGAYANILDGKAFADQLTQDLQSINHDKHMQVWFNPPPPPPPSDNLTSPVANLGNAKLSKLKRQRSELEENYGFYKVERLAGNVGYIDFRYFSGSDKAKSVAISAMKLLEGTDALIIDMRNNTGGNPDMVRFICSYFLAKNTHLNSLYWRAPDITEEYWTLDTVVGKRRIDVPLYVLTSSKTFSGAEELTYNFKTQKRATIVGEVTGGGANPGSEVNINELFSMFMPTGTAINPITKTNWEGTGVMPDVKSSAEQAFDKAYQLAKVAAQKYRLNDLDKKLAQSQLLMTELVQIEQLVKTNKAIAINKTEQTFKQSIADELLDESQINLMGYEYLVDKQNTAMAILIFSFNAKNFPYSFNAFDSLGEAYLKQGNNKLARLNYKKSLHLNPDNPTAKQFLSE
ncbi:S41 family peptidase [Colwellia psychrerythraea]|uniref:Peptidase S41 n=1 Tax=Colwellia psychrerythraea TaxID=28229 RepID=A0A099KML0_COLPS|nr:S41 family peptidase [Colwellia psychrerythraea]KGJ91696.1 peptidase S41 [Colwellia psychrerythraea]